MAIHLRGGLENRQRDLIALARTVELAVQKAIGSSPRRDSGFAMEVIAGDAAIDEEKNRIEDEYLKLLALHQPVAIDLRLAKSCEGEDAEGAWRHNEVRETGSMSRRENKF